MRRVLRVFRAALSARRAMPEGLALASLRGHSDMAQTASIVLFADTPNDAENREENIVNAQRVNRDRG